MIDVELPSAPMIHTPSIVAYLINGYHFKKDRKKLRKVLTEGFDLSDECAHDLLSGKIQHTVKGESVWFKYDENKIHPPAMAT